MEEEEEVEVEVEVESYRAREPQSQRAREVGGMILIVFCKSLLADRIARLASWMRFER